MTKTIKELNKEFRKNGRPIIVKNGFHCGFRAKESTDFLYSELCETISL